MLIWFVIVIGIIILVYFIIRRVLFGKKDKKEEKKGKKKEKERKDRCRHWSTKTFTIKNGSGESFLCIECLDCGIVSKIRSD